MRYLRNVGTLSLAHSLPGRTVVQCVRAPTTELLEFWDELLGIQAWWFKPEPNEYYIVRSNQKGPPSFPEKFRNGVLLYRLGNARPFTTLRNPEINIGFGISSVEPFFPYDHFNFARHIDRP